MCKNIADSIAKYKGAKYTKYKCSRNWLLYDVAAFPLQDKYWPFAQDLSGRPHLSFDLQCPTERIGTYDVQLVEHFFQSVANTGGITLHIRKLAGTTLLLVDQSLYVLIHLKKTIRLYL